MSHPCAVEREGAQERELRDGRRQVGDGIPREEELLQRPDPHNLFASEGECERVSVCVRERVCERERETVCERVRVCVCV